ncbi:peptidase [Lentzea pudingi]|uniref:Peptidase n=1 Tax=Lentzea pudingi TaxID=1789439 RepID=A0ABQ2ITQ2_9PSEU|nr:DUF4397 domain-containing protein [Lentzea pudingi]GGN29045.1 peptidase [Lentzea pudingi]
MTTRRLSTIVLTTAVAAIALGPVASAAPAAPPTGWVRLGHLSPSTPAVDVYLAPLGGPSQEVIRKASYGTLTGYNNLVPGPYTVAMRPAGASADSPAILNWTVQIKAGSASTVLAVGDRENLRSSVITDELSPPASGKAKVRLIQGAPSEAKVEVSAMGGPTLARDVAYGTATGYAEVSEGRWTLDVKASGDSTATVDVRAGSVQSLLVLDKPGGGLEVKPVTDGSGMAAMPLGGVETGAGGTAPTSVVPVLGAGAMLLVAGAALLRRRRVVAATR